MKGNKSNTGSASASSSLPSSLASSSIQAGSSASQASTIQSNLTNTRSLINSDPVKAFELLIETARLAGGEEAVKELLIHARRIRDFHKEQDKEIEENLARAALNELVNDPNSILYERGSEQILSDAFTDGSSVVCSKCNGLIKRDRWDNHLKYWCNRSLDDDDIDSDGDDNGNSNDKDKMDEEDANLQRTILQSLKQYGENAGASSASASSSSLEEGYLCAKCDQFVGLGKIHLCPAGFY